MQRELVERARRRRSRRRARSGRRARPAARRRCRAPRAPRARPRRVGRAEDVVARVAGLEHLAVVAERLAEDLGVLSRVRGHEAGPTWPRRGRAGRVPLAIRGFTMSKCDPLERRAVPGLDVHRRPALGQSSSVWRVGDDERRPAPGRATHSATPRRRPSRRPREPVAVVRRGRHTCSPPVATRPSASWIAPAGCRSTGRGSCCRILTTGHSGHCTPDCRVLARVRRLASPQGCAAGEQRPTASIVWSTYPLPEMRPPCTYLTHPAAAVTPPWTPPSTTARPCARPSCTSAWASSTVPIRLSTSSGSRAGQPQWGETGVGLNSTRMRAALRPQDGLYTVLERTSESESASVVGVMRDYLYAPDDPQAVLDRLADPATRIVTLTITGDGYSLDDNGDFAPSDALVRDDVRGPRRPRTWLGYVVEALARRRAAGAGGFTVLSCDNLANSGAAAETAVVGLRPPCRRDAGAVDRAATSRFPDSMVDRITPAATDAAAELVERAGSASTTARRSSPSRSASGSSRTIRRRPPAARGRRRAVRRRRHAVQADEVGCSTAATARWRYLGYLAGHRTTADMMNDPVMRTFLPDDAGRDRTAAAGGARCRPCRVPGHPARAVRQRADRRRPAPAPGRGSTKVPSYLLPSLVEARAPGIRAPADPGRGRVVPLPPGHGPRRSADRDHRRTP